MHAIFSSASDVDHCRDHLGRDDRRLGHRGHRLDDQHPGHLGHRLDDQHLDRRTHDLGHLGDQHPGRHLDDQRLERLDALDRRYLLGHGQEHLPVNDQCEHPRRHLGDQHLGQKGEGPLADDQLRGHLDAHFLEVEELDDHHRVAVELDDRLAQYEEQQ